MSESNIPEPDSWTTVMSQNVKVGDFVWAEGEWQFVTSSSRIERPWVQRVFCGAFHFDFPVNGDVLIKKRGS